MENKRIAELAIETRAHLVEALTGLDEIIRLAQAAGRDDIAAAAKQAKQPVAQAAMTFNGQVAKNDGDATKIDPVAINEANAASTKGKQTCEELLKELTKRVDGHDAAIAQLAKRVDGHDARFGEAEANLKELNGAIGIVKKPDGTWVPTPDGTFNQVAQNDGNFDMKAFAICVVIGIVAGLLLGLIGLWLEFGLAGPVGGIFIGAIVGAAVGLWFGSRKTKS